MVITLNYMTLGIKLFWDSYTYSSNVLYSRFSYKTWIMDILYNTAIVFWGKAV